MRYFGPSGRGRDGSAGGTGAHGSARERRAAREAGHEHAVEAAGGDGRGGAAAWGGLLAACSAGPIWGDGGAPAAARQPVTLQYWSRFGTGAGRPIRADRGAGGAAAPVFTEQHPQVRVERTVVSNHSELLEKLTVAFVSGTGPDVFNVGSPGIAQFAHPGFLLPLDGVPGGEEGGRRLLRQPGLRIGSVQGEALRPDLLRGHADHALPQGPADPGRAASRAQEAAQDVGAARELGPQAGPLGGRADRPHRLRRAPDGRGFWF